MCRKPQGGIPESVSLYPDWDDLKRERAAFDDTIDRVGGQSSMPHGLRATSPIIRAPRSATSPGRSGSCVTHMFNHQTHHRGQVHCMLTQAGGKPHATDLPAMPE